jgi:hypothetical protein
MSNAFDLSVSQEQVQLRKGDFTQGLLLRVPNNTPMGPREGRRASGAIPDRPIDDGDRIVRRAEPCSVPFP